jgi:PAP2 superfamily
MNRSAAGLIIAVLLSACLGCATTPIRKEGEADLRFLPTGPRWRHASVNAFRHPITWGAAAGAAVVAAGGWDKKISRWAVERTPVFGSVARAKSASDDLRALCNFGMLGTVLAVPGGDYPWRSRFERLLVEEGGVWTASSFTSLTQRNIDRERPDESNHHGFPSGHSTRAFAYNGMTSRNLDAIEMPDATRTSLEVLFTGLAAGTAWARVEGQKHYPSDVLAGAAVGNFISIFLHDAFLGRKEKIAVGVRMEREERSLTLRIALP